MSANEPLAHLFVVPGYGDVGIGASNVGIGITRDGDMVVEITEGMSRAPVDSIGLREALTSAIAAQDQMARARRAQIGALTEPVYRFSGVTRSGAKTHGLTCWPNLARAVESLFDQGWRELIVVAGNGPSPPRADEHRVAEIGPDPDWPKRRVWNAENRSGSEC